MKAFAAGEPVFDADAETAAAIEELCAADVCLVQYHVLQQACARCLI